MTSTLNRDFSGSAGLQRAPLCLLTFSASPRSFNSLLEELSPPTIHSDSTRIDKLLATRCRVHSANRATHRGTLFKLELQKGFLFPHLESRAKVEKKKIIHF